MFKNRSFNVVVAIALALVIALTVREAVATSAVVQADRAYDQVELLRSGRSEPSLAADQSYDLIESVRLQRNSDLVADRSYDAIENLRAQRAMR